MNEKTRISTVVPTPTRWTESEARRALTSLKTALEYVGIVLPSLDLDHVSTVSSIHGPLIELGRCRPDVALELAEVIRRGVPLERA
jgi:hypothetical protein